MAVASVRSALLKVRAGGHAGTSGALNAKYGIDPGVVVCTHVSGQYDPFHTKVLSATMGEALRVW